MELKAEGGYVVAPGSPPAVHPSRRLYCHITGPFLDETPVLSDSQMELLLCCARSLTQVRETIVAEQPCVPIVPVTTGDRPGDVFNRTATWEQVLCPHGWKAVQTRGAVTYWRRPGKQERGWSASTGYCTSKLDGTDLLAVFSTNAGCLAVESDATCRCFTKFAAFTLLNFDGDFHAAAANLTVRHDTSPARIPGLAFNRDAQPAPCLFNALLTNDRRFARSWNHQRLDIKQTTAAYETSLAALVHAAGWPDQEIINLILAHRQRWAPQEIGVLLAGGYLAGLLTKVKAARAPKKAVIVI